MTKTQEPTGFSSPWTTKGSKRRHWAWSTAVLAIVTVILAVCASETMAFPATVSDIDSDYDFDFDTLAVTGFIGSKSEKKKSAELSSGDDTEGYQNDAAISVEDIIAADMS